MFSLTMCFVLLSLIECQPGNKTDTRYCKMSPTGIEYDGYVSHTESGIPCQYWDSSNPTHKMDESITDKDFKEGSKRAARNYCRNIKGKYSNPWCYTTNPDVIYEICDIPLCNFPCRLTLSGVEYGGQENVSIIGRPCLKWSEKTYRKYLKKQNISTSDRVLVDSIFPEHSRKKASNYCRNPTGDPNGPWCLVEDEFLTKVKYEKEYCDVKLCNETKCTVATSSINNKGVYSHFVELNNDSLTFDFTLQLWNIDLEKAEFHVALIVHPLPVSGHRLIDTYNGVDLSISNNRVGFIFRRAQYDNWHDIPGLLSGVKERSFSITWYILQQIMSLKISDYPKELRIGYNFPIDPYSTIIGHNKGVPSYYSISGDVGFWNLPCPKGCEEHITILPHCNVYYKMKKTKLSHEISFIVRSDHTIYIELRNSPNSQYPYFKIEIFGRWNDTSIAFIESENALPEYLGTVTQDSILTYWSWSKFQLSVSGNHIKLDWLKDLIPSETIFDMDHPKISNAKWYSICSNGTAHWRFDCSLESIPQLPQRKPPECVRSKKAENYIGNQWVSKSGQPCFPWLDEEVVEFTKGYTIPQGKRGEQKNYCRNIGSDKDGPYCYIADVMQLPNIVVKKESCNMRPCIGSQCKTTGLGREYDGNLAISRSNRTCKPWVDTNTTFVPNGYTANLTNNYCRNPNNNSFGPWCYTDDPLVPKDLCSIEECFVNDACTFVIQDNRKYRQFYLHPDWVRDVFPFKVKTWDPLKEAGIAILIMYENNDQFFTLEVGIENNKKVRLSYCCVNDKTVTLKENIIPNLIPTGYWQGFWVRVPPASIELGYQGSDTSIFSWQRSSNSDTNGQIPSGLAKFISLLNLGNYWVGFNFPCDFCLIEETGSESFTYSGSSESIFYPINYWSETNNFTEPLTLHMRTKVQRVDAYTMIRLFEESQDSYLYVVISETDMTLYNESNSVLERVILDHPLLSENFWTTFTIKHDENLIEISDQHRTIIRWSSKGIRALRFYYFVINCFGSVTTWVANCRRPLIDEGPIDGGWSEWSPWGCNVRCGGGFGFRERKCNNPRPNYKGKPCFGVAREGGECNKFECGCVNPITITNATNVIRRRAINKEAKEGDGITLQCEKSIMESVKADSPGSYVQWLKDGYRMKNRKWKLQNLDIQKTDLYLTDLKESDSGLYMCVINPDCLPTNNSTFIPFTIIALVVDAEEHLVRETTNYELICQGLPLSFILTDLSQRWELNSELLIDYTTTDLAEAEIDILYDVNPYYAGTWQCKISQNKLKLTWLTNRFKIRVIDPPTIYTYLSEEDAPSILFNGWNHTLIFLFLWSVIILEILAVGYIVYWYWKVRQELLGNT